MAIAAQVQATTEEILREISSHVVMIEEGRFMVPHGSVRALISVIDTLPHDDEAPVFVEVMIPCLLKLLPSPQLNEFVAERSADYKLGHFILNTNDDGTLSLGLVHNFWGDSLSRDELAYAVASLLTSADENEKEWHEILGGVRIEDYPG